MGGSLSTNEAPISAHVWEGGNLVRNQDVWWMVFYFCYVLFMHVNTYIYIIYMFIFIYIYRYIYEGDRRACIIFFLIGSRLVFFCWRCNPWDPTWFQWCCLWVRGCSLLHRPQRYSRFPSSHEPGCQGTHGELFCKTQPWSSAQFQSRALENALYFSV